MYADDNPLRRTDPTGHAACEGDPDQCAALFAQAQRFHKDVPGFNPYTVVTGTGATLAIGPMAASRSWS